MSATGCNWVVAKVKRWSSTEKKYQLVPVHCNKLPDKDSQYCPKHKLFSEFGEKQGVETYVEGR